MDILMDISINIHIHYKPGNATENQTGVSWLTKRRQFVRRKFCQSRLAAFGYKQEATRNPPSSVTN